jgi:dihydrolipoamide dehydrogenase
MARDYDLVIIGGTKAGLQAAIAAVRQNARVALVAPLPFAAESAWANQALGKFTQDYDQTSWQADHHLELKARRAQAAQWISAQVASLKAEYAPAYLTSLGIDLITSFGQFQPQPKLHFFAAGRMLRSQAYLIASDRPEAGILGLSPGNYLTPDTLWPHLQKRLQTDASKWLVVSDQPIGIELAQALTRLGEQVIIVIAGNSLLPQEDPQTVFWLQTQLEAAGISILTQTTLQAAKPAGEGWLVFLNSAQKPLHVDQILVCQSGNGADVLNLDSIWVRYDQQRVWVNDRLQTSQPQIYACGDLLGGYTVSQITDQEASLAVYNALHRSKCRIDYRCLAWSLQTKPVWARVGMSETQARATYGADSVEQANLTFAQRLLAGESPELCQLVVHRNGLILGATILSPLAMELIQVVRLFLQQRLKVSALAKLATGSANSCEIVYQTAAKILSRSR